MICIAPVLLFFLIFFSGIIAGFLGALTGLGGGTILVPILSLYVGVPIAYATGASLISTISTSSGAASAYVKERLTNVKIGIGLEIGTTSGAIMGSLTATYIYAHHLSSIIFVAFGVILLLSIYPTAKKITGDIPSSRKPDWSTRFFGLSGEYYDESLKKTVHYDGSKWWLGLMVMIAAGFISGLLGIGSGALKVLGMDYAMALPIKVTTTTSNFMIGVTAATSSGIYWADGLLQPFIVAPTAIGVLIGAMFGTRVLVKMRNNRIRLVFLALLAILGVQMILRGLGLF